MPSSRKPHVPREAAGKSGRKPGGAPVGGSGGATGGGSTPVNSTAGKAATTGGVITASRSLSGLPGAADNSKAPAGSGGASILAFPEPKGKRRRRNVLITALVAAALTAGVVAGAIYSPVLAIRTVTVSGTKLLTVEQVQEALRPVQGVPLPQVAEAEVAALLAPLVQVKDVRVQARPPSELVVEIRERVPVALVKQGEQHLLVDVDGVELAAGADPAATALPVIDGGAGAIGQELFQATAAVLGALPPEILARLSNASAQSVDAVELKLVDGQTVVWGNAEDRSLKAKVLQALLQVPADPKNPVRVYDVSAPRNPVTR